MMTNYGLTLIAIAWIIAASNKKRASMSVSFVWLYVIGIVLLIADSYPAGITPAVALNGVALVAAFITAVKMKKA